MSRKDRKKRRENKQMGEVGIKKVWNILGGSFLIKDNFIKQFPFILTVTILLMVLITNTYIAEARTREIAKTNRQLHELRAKYVELKANVMEASLQSTLIKKLEGTGVKESLDPLFRIEEQGNTNDKEGQE
jgi:hypothetical protein